jgi:hypothetical protein
MRKIIPAAASFIRRVRISPSKDVFLKILDFVFGYDFFISYSHRDGMIYPQQLADRLKREFNFRVFLDTREYRAGDDLLTGTSRRVRSSKMLVLVAREHALGSGWVLKEVKACIQARRTPIVLDINQTFDRCLSASPLKGLLEDRLFISETLSDIDDAPSDATVQEIRRSFQGTRQESLRLRVFVGAAVVFAFVAAIAAWQTKQAITATHLAERRALAAEARRIASQADALIDTRPQRALLLAVEAVRLERRFAEPGQAAGEQVLRDTLARVSGRRVFTLPKYGSLALNTTSKRVAVGGEFELPVWNFETGKPEISLPQTGNRIGSMAFDSTGRWLVAADYDDAVQLWDLSTSPANRFELVTTAGLRTFVAADGVRL